MIIAIDHGNKQIKTPHKTFTSGLMSSDVPFPLSTDSLRYNGKYYTLTDERIPYMRDKTANEKFFVLSLFAIAYELLYSEKYVSGIITDIDLAIGLPPGHFGKQYKEFQKYFVKPETIEFEFNQKKFRIIINSATAYPQGFAAIMPKILKIREFPRAVVIDIGGYSLDYLQLKYGKPDMAMCDSLDMGVITLYNEIKSRINASEDMLIDENDIDAVLQNKPTVFEERIKKLIEQLSMEFTEKIIYSLRERHIDLKTTHAIFVGGGSVLLSTFIRASDKIAAPDIIENINANALGYELLLQKQKENNRR